MFKLKYISLLFLILQTLALNANAYCELRPYKRKVLKEDVNGFQLVQDFYKNGKKRTDPYYVIEPQKNEIYKQPCIKIAFFSRNGNYVEYDKNGMKTLEGQYQEGNRQGIWRAWNKQGKQTYEAKYDGETNIGEVTKWFSNGVKAKGKEIYEYGRDINTNSPNGYWRFYKDNKLIGEGNYYDGYPTGIWYQWCNGKKSIKLTFIDGSNYHIASHIVSEELLLSKAEIAANKCTDIMDNI